MASSWRLTARPGSPTAASTPIVRFDPKTKKFDYFMLPPQLPSANLNTGVFDKDGVYWFTGQNGVHGSVNAKTGKLESWKSPRRGSYGITVTPGNEVWYVALAGDHLGKIDKATGNVDIVEPHKKGAGPRRVWSDSKGVLWVSFWHSGEVGRYDPAAKAWKTWLLPGNPGSGCYSVYVDEQDKVWLTDFLTNSIVRFDPADRDSSKPSRAASAARRCARCSAGRAKPGAPNPATTGWCKLSIDAPRAPGPPDLC